VYSVYGDVRAESSVHLFFIMTDQYHTFPPIFCMCMFICYDMHLAITEQSAGVLSLLPPRDFQGLHSGHRDWKPLTHLTSSLTSFKDVLTYFYDYGGYVYMYTYTPAEGVNPMGLQLQMVVSHHVGAGN